MGDDALRHMGWLGWGGLVFGIFGGGTFALLLTWLTDRR